MTLGVYQVVGRGRPSAAAALLLLAAAPLLAGCPPQGPTSAPDQQLAAPASQPAAPPLRLTDISFAGPAGHRPDATFMPGEQVLCLLSATGFAYRQGKVHLVVDLTVTGPGGLVVLQLRGTPLLEGEAPTARPGAVRTAAALPLSPATPPGAYRVAITVRDLLGQRQGQSEGRFSLLGDPAPAVPRLTIDQLRLAAGKQTSPGAVVPIALRALGVHPQKTPEGYQVSLQLTAVLVDAAGEQLHRLEEPLVRGKLPFPPAALPLEVQLPLPADLPPGAYQLRLTLTEPGSSGQATDQLALNLVPPALAVRGLHVHGAGGLPRQTFLLGEQIFVRLAVAGLTSRQGRASAAVDLAIAGPEGGIYLARKEAASLAGPASAAVARSGRFPVQIPLVLPALAPVGPYRIVIRAQDRLAGREVVGEQQITLQGQAPRPLGRFTIDQLVVHQRPDLPPEKGDTFVAGRSYQLGLLVGGGELKESKRLHYPVRIKASLRLKRPGGQLVAEADDLFQLSKTFTYRPLRVLLQASWQVPADLPRGLYDLELVATDTLNDQVSQLVRRVEILP